MASKKAVIYTRFSPRPNAKDSESCETQLDYCRKHCEAKGWIVVAAEKDEGLSGARADNRPGLQKAIFSAMKNKAVLVVYSLSRLARSLQDTLKIIEKLRKYGADISSVREPIDTTSAMGEAFFQIIAVLAELERKQISERTSDAMLRHQATGRRMSYLLPYGNMADPENPALMIDNPEEQEIIQKIMRWHNAGVSLRRIVDILNENELPARTNGWHHSKIECIVNRYKDLKVEEVVPVEAGQ